MSKKRITMTPDMTKVVNKRIVLEHLLRHSPTSRAEIARHLQLSKPTVSLIISELVHEGFARELGTKKSGQGRPSIEVEMNPRARYAIGVELDVSLASLIITDLLSQPIDDMPPLIQAEIDTATPDRAAVSLSALIKQVVAELAHKTKALDGSTDRPPRLVGIGIGVPAVVNSQTMEVISSNPLNWSGPEPFGAIVQEHVRTPVLVTQRVMAAAWAEHMFGSGRGEDSLVFARFGSGVATGIILNNQLYTGSSYFAGDIASMTFLPHGSPNDLAQPVSLQSLVTREVITARARQLLLEGVYPASSALDAAGGDPQHITLEMLCDGAMQNDALSRRVIVEAGRFVGVAIANLIGIMNPALVVLGGPLTQAGGILLESVHEQVKRCCNRHEQLSVRIILSELGDRAPALGAAN
ncbi:MAG: ROK family protein, partial [Chloroflexi bacterium]|nr:ROK family protein [Chloroflexota bacterium]